MPTLTVDLAEHSYPIHIGRGLLSDPRSWETCGPASLVVTSEAVAAHHLPALRQGLGDRAHEVLVLPDGEAAKSVEMLTRITTAAIEAGVARDGTFIALGGGAIGDVTGFAAAVFHRGIGFIQVPTTLLAQVDSSVGGKTAVNHPLGKNLIGAFHQPRAVIADLATLATLPDREFRCGLAEIIKAGMLDAALFERLETLMDALRRREKAALEEVIEDCCEFKARIVRADEHEHGERALLNLGHTFGHALESAYAGELQHGEAVALGCMMASRMSLGLGWLTAAEVSRVIALIERAGLPTTLPGPVPDPDDIAARMRRDKKMLDGVVRLVLPRGIGEAVVTGDYPRAALELTLREATGTES